MFNAIDKHWAPWTGEPETNNAEGGGISPGKAVSMAPEWLKSAGFTGEAFDFVRDNNGADPIGQTSQALKDWLTQKGYRIEVGNSGDKFHSRIVDQSGQMVGDENEWDQNDDPGNLFGLAILGAAGFGGALALGAGAGAGAGAANGSWDAVGGLQAGELGGGIAGTGVPEYAAYQAPGYQVAGDAAVAPEGFFAGSADKAALYGAEGYGAAASPAELAAYGGSAGGGGLLNQLGGYASDAASWMQANPGLTNVGGSLLNGAIGAYTSGKALDKQTDATNAANALWAPYRELGNAGVTGYNKLMQNPNSVMNDPGVAFQQQQGQQALDRRAAAGGGIYSGAQMKAATRFNQDFASTALDKALARYSNAAQLGATGTTNTANNITNLGNAGAGAAFYTGNVLQNGLNSSLAQFNQSTYANPLYPGYRG